MLHTDTRTRFILHFNALLEQRKWTDVRTWLSGFERTFRDAGVLDDELTKAIKFIERVVTIGQPGAKFQLSSELALEVQRRHIPLVEKWIELDEQKNGENHE